MKKRKILSAALAAALSLSLLTPAMAAELPADDPTQAAQALYDLGLFNGTGVDENGQPIYDLDRTPTRNEAVTMLVRLLGKDEEAKAGTWETPFTDVEAWAAPYVGYAYANKLTTGTSDTTFGGAQTVSPSQYLTFVLRAMGYESGTDFQWDKAWELTDTLGITHGEYGPDTSFTRGNVALISHSALSASPKGGDKSLLESLGLGKPVDPTPTPTPTPTPAPSVPAADLELVNKGGSTGIDPQRPVESAPPISGIKIPSGMGLQVGESDEGLMAAGTVLETGRKTWITESEKYVQLSDDIIGTVKTEYRDLDGSDGPDYIRMISLDLILYVGDSVTLNLNDYGYNTKSNYWLISEGENYISTSESGEGLCTIKALNPVAYYEAGGIGYHETNTHDDLVINITIYEKKPSNWNANFHISTDYEPVYYTNGTLGTWWVTEKGVKFNGSNGVPAKSEFGMNADYIRIYPDSSMGIPSSDIENGYIKDEAVGKYFDFSCNLEEYNNRRINVGPTGGIETPCVDFTSSDCDHKATITVTSKKDGRSCSIDIACLYYNP